MASTSAAGSGSSSIAGLGLSGLSSGLDTSGIISKLMAIESQPQTLLQSQLATLKTHTTALQSLNTAVAAVATTAQSAIGSNALTSFTASTSSTAAVATASALARAGTTTFTVDQLAQTQLSVTGPMPDTSSLASADHTVTVRVGTGAGMKVTAASGSVDDMVAAINAAKAGVIATKVSSTAVDGVPQYRIQLTSTASGAASGFALFRGDSTAPGDQLGSGSSPSLTTVTAAQDAQVTLYPNSAAAQPVTSATNKFVGLATGVDVTVSSTTPGTSTNTITVSPDPSAAVTSAQALTAGLISVFAGLASATAITTSSSTSGGASSSVTSGGVFTGDTLVRGVKDALLAAVSDPDPTTKRSPSTIGITLTKDGTITFDQAKFTAAMASDPTGTTAMYQAIAKRVSDTAGGAPAPSTGIISQAVTSETGRQSDMSTKISDWDARLTTIQAQYQLQFNNLEIALNSLSSQSNYLTSQITGLTTNYQSK